MDSVHETAEAAVQDRVSEGATAEGDDVDSVVAALIAAVDTAADQSLPLASARAVIVVFADDGSVAVHALDDAAASGIKLGDGGVTISADTIRGYLAATDSAEDEPRDSMPPEPGASS